MAAKYLLIDGNALGYAAHNSKKVTKNADGMETQAVYGALRTLRNIRLKYRDYIPWVLWDGRAEFRFDILPEYKGNRTDTAKKVASKQAYRTQRPYIESAFKALGIAQFISPLYEADDLAGYISRHLYSHEKMVLLVSADHDWMQLINRQVSWIDPRKLESPICGEHNFFERTGYLRPERFLQGKAIQGDTSDNIAGIQGLGKVASKEILTRYGDISLLFEEQTIRGGRFSPEDLHKNLRRYCGPINKLCQIEGKRIYQRNIELMDLRTDVRDLSIKDTMRCTAEPMNMESFKNVCLVLGFNSMLRMTDWQKLFGKQNKGTFK